MVAKENKDPPFMEREPVNKMDRQKQMRKIMRTLAPTEDDIEVVTPTHNPHTLWAITRLQFPERFLDPNLQEPFREADISSEMVEHLIHAI